MAGRTRAGLGRTGTGWGAGTCAAHAPGKSRVLAGEGLLIPPAPRPPRGTHCERSPRPEGAAAARCPGWPRARAAAAWRGRGPGARDGDRGREPGLRPGARAVRAPGRPQRAAGAAGRWLRSSCAGSSEGHIPAAAAAAAAPPRARGRSGRRRRRCRGWPGRGSRPGAGLASGPRRAGGAASSHQPPGSGEGFHCGDQRLKRETGHRGVVTLHAGFD